MCYQDSFDIENTLWLTLKASKLNQINLSPSVQLLTKPPLSTATATPATFEVPEDERQQGEKEREEEKEEQERLNALLQREKLLRDLGVVDQIYQLLQGRTTGGGHPLLRAQGTHPHQRGKQAQQRQQQTKVRHKYGAVCVYHKIAFI